MKYFLLVYDRKRGEIRSQSEYPSAARDKALADRFALLQAQTDPEVEVVLLGANSYDDLRKTHGRYFMTLKEAVSAQ